MFSSERQCISSFVPIHEAKLQIESIKDALSSMDETIQLQDRSTVCQLDVESDKTYIEPIQSLFCVVCWKQFTKGEEIQVKSSCWETAYHNSLVWRLQFDPGRDLLELWQDSFHDFMSHVEFDLLKPGTGSTGNHQEHNGCPNYPQYIQIIFWLFLPLLRRRTNWPKLTPPQCIPVQTTEYWLRQAKLGVRRIQFFAFAIDLYTCDILRGHAQARSHAASEQSKVYGRLSENLPKHAKDTLTSHASFINEEASQRKSKMEQLHQKLNQTKDQTTLREVMDSDGKSWKREVVRSFDHSCPLNKPRKFGFFRQLLAWVPTSDTLMFEPLNLNPSPHVVLWRPGGADRIHQQPPCRPGEVHQFKTQPTDHVLGTKQQLHISNRHKQTALREKLILQTHQYEQSPLYNRMINIYFIYSIFIFYVYINNPSRRFPYVRFAQFHYHQVHFKCISFVFRVGKMK